MAQVIRCPACNALLLPWDARCLACDEPAVTRDREESRLPLARVRLDRRLSRQAGDAA